MLHRLKSKFTALSRGGKIAVITAALVTFGAAASASNSNQSSIETKATQPALQLEKATPAVINEPKFETRTTVEVVDVPFEKKTIEDADLATGQLSLRAVGVVGKKSLTYEVTIVDGVETDKKLVSEAITVQPVAEVIAKGIKVAVVPKPASSCSPHYSGCVPIASDVDCGGGSGNGPAYAYGPFNVIGTDIYDLDRDGDGIACE